MIERFQYYVDEGLVKKVSPNKAMARSLIKKAISRSEYIESQTITKKNASFIFEDVYESIREAGQSLMALKGYRPYSHVALISFLKEFFDFSGSDISTLNRYRILRNKAIYGAATISASVCKEAKRFMKQLLPKIKQDVDKLI